MITDSNEARDGRTCAYRVLRYTPNPVRDEWVSADESRQPWCGLGKN